jgi:hypothetical protein
MGFRDEINVNKWEEETARNRDTHVQVYGVRLQVLIHVVKIVIINALILVVANQVVIVCMEHQRVVLVALT